MTETERIFNATFAAFHISLPPEAVARKQRGKIVAGGWVICYLFGGDGRGEYLDYYASHRMTEDRHVRIYADGTVKGLPSIDGMCVFPAGCTRAEEERISKEHDSRNRQIAEELAAKGFDLSGDEPGGVAINRHLRLKEDKG